MIWSLTRMPALAHRKVSTLSIQKVSLCIHTTSMRSQRHWVFYRCVSTWKCCFYERKQTHTRHARHNILMSARPLIRYCRCCWRCRCHCRRHYSLLQWFRGAAPLLFSMSSALARSSAPGITMATLNAIKLSSSWSSPFPGTAGNAKPWTDPRTSL